jgi:hypothetical protein
MIDGLVGSIRLQVLLADIGDIGRPFVFGEQVVERLVPTLLSFGQIDRPVRQHAVDKHRVNIEHHATERMYAMAYHLSDLELGD